MLWFLFFFKSWFLSTLPGGHGSGATSTPSHLEHCLWQKNGCCCLLFVLRKRRWPRLKEIRKLFVGPQVTGEADTSSEFATTWGADVCRWGSRWRRGSSLAISALSLACDSTTGLCCKSSDGECMSPGRTTHSGGFPVVDVDIQGFQRPFETALEAFLLSASRALSPAEFTTNKQLLR